LVEHTYRLIEAQEQAVSASAVNIQSSRNSGTSAVLATVQAAQDELALSFLEEVDGRVNEE
jgi:hypothetical protein